MICVGSRVFTPLGGQKSLALLLGGIWLLLDFTLKSWITAHFSPPSSLYRSYPYGGIGVFQQLYGIEFSIHHATNSGAAWGLFANYPLLLFLFRVTAILLMTAYFFCVAQSPRRDMALALILSGAMGNILDYFLYGHVIDMFHFIFFGFDYPVFNLADSAIFMGVLLWLMPMRKQSDSLN